VGEGRVIGNLGIRRFRLATACLLAILSGIPGPARAQQAWIGSWGASPGFPVGPELAGTTIRQFVRLSAGGPALRVRFSNETGTRPLVIGAAGIARPGPAPGSIDAVTSHALTFGGAAAITVPPGRAALSDPVALAVPPLTTLAVSLYLPRPTGPTVIHRDGEQTAYLSNRGDATAVATLPAARPSTMRFILSGIEVSASGGTLVAFGDSITDGTHSGIDANRRWPDRLAERLVHAGGQPIGVVNAGISGNRLLHDTPGTMYGPSALARFDRDALSVPGIRWVVILEGINDIGHSGDSNRTDRAATADQIVAGLQQLVARARSHGVKAFCATLTPFEGTGLGGYYTPRGEAKRQAVNAWIRDGRGCDGVIDFDAVLRDPARPARLRPAFDSGDHLHPNAAGYAAMAAAVDLDLLR
jgi:lysophospholipase L1-like esterase